MHDPLLKGSISLGVLGNRVNDLYVFDHREIHSSLSFCFSVSTFFPLVNKCEKQCHSDVMLWHNHFGHIPSKKLQSISLFPNNYSIHQLDSCDICATAKQHKLPFPKSLTTTTSCFDLIHIDVWGP